MSQFTIETTYRLPCYRHRNYEAETLEVACALAIEDRDWEGAEFEEVVCGETFISGAWTGWGSPDWDSSLPVPDRFDERLQRKGEHFNLMLGLLKALQQTLGAEQSDGALLRDRIAAAIVEGEAILAD